MVLLPQQRWLPWTLGEDSSRDPHLRALAGDAACKVSLRFLSAWLVPGRLVFKLL